MHYKPATALKPCIQKQLPLQRLARPCKFRGQLTYFSFDLVTTQLSKLSLDSQQGSESDSDPVRRWSVWEFRGQLTCFSFDLVTAQLSKLSPDFPRT